MKVVTFMEDLVARGQEQIGAYDKQLWEKSVEERVLKNIAQVPKKNGRVKAELIDVDLVRGSTFTKAKPQHGWLAVSRMGLLRLILLPIFLKWWQNQTTRWFTALLLLLYILQLGATAVYMTDTNNVTVDEGMSLAHLTSPWILTVVLGLMHAQIVATRLIHKHAFRPKNKKNHSKTEKRKRKVRSRFNMSERESGETGPDTHVEEDSSSSRERKRLNKLSKRSDRLKTGIRKKSSPRREFAPDRTRRQEEKEVVSTASDKGANTEEETGCCDGTPVYVSKSTLNKSAETGSSRTRGFGPQRPAVTRSTLCSIPKITCCDEIVSVSYKSVDVRDDGVVVGCDSEQGTLNDPITNYSGEILLPDQNTQDIRLTDDLIIHCDCVTPESDKHKSDRGSADSSTPHSAKPPKYISQSASVFYKDSNVVNNIKNGNHSPGAGSKSDTRASHRSACCDEGISMDISPRAVPDDRSPTEDVSVSSACSDSLLYDTKKPREAATLIRTSAKSAFHPPIIVRTDGESAATNDETDSEISVPFREPDVTLCRRRRPGSAGAECDTSKAGSKKVTKTDRLSVRVAELKESTGLSSCESEQETTPNTPVSLRGQTSEYEWDTMHSEVTSSDTSSCSTDSESSDRDDREDPFRSTHVHNSSSVMSNLASSSDKVSCMIWEEDQVKKVDLSVLDIGWTIIQKVDKIPQMCDYVVLGVVFALTFTLTPLVFRAYTARSTWTTDFSSLQHAVKFCTVIFGAHWRVQVIVLNGAVQRFSLALIFFFLLSVADRTFKQRLLYAKNFSYLTSSRRAKKYELPHFRLNKVRNIKTWLSLRSYLKKRGPQRSIDTIVSAAFILAVIFVSLMCLKLLQDSGGFLDYLGNWELVGWCLALAIYLLRFMTIGTKINRKYRNFSVLITEQINLYLHMEQKPHKKDELMLANSVLKLAEDLLKELESPFKISGLSANPFLYNVTKVIVLSAFSAVLTELLGFKLKLYKIKLRP